MKDQAESLRNRIQQKNNNQHAKAIAVVSGKGGVGKSNFSLNFAISLSKKGYNVLLFDMDVGMGNIDILLGNSARSTIVDYFDGKEELANTVAKGPYNLSYIAGGTGLAKLINLGDETLDKFTDDLSLLLSHYEYIIFDMGAGATKESLHFILSVDEIIVVTTPEPTSITDAYAMMKHVFLKNSEATFFIMVNRVHSDTEGNDTFNRLSLVSKKFLGKDVKPLGMLPDDRAVQQAVVKQLPFVLNDKSAASKALIKILDRYLQQSSGSTSQEKGALHFLTRFRRFLFER